MIILLSLNNEYDCGRPTTYNEVYPQEVTEENSVPDHIQRPSYLLDGEEDIPSEPILKTAKEIMLMKSSCRLARKMLNAAGKQIKVCFKISIRLQYYKR